MWREDRHPADASRAEATLLFGDPRAGVDA
jgi:hypothetical protein